MGGTEHGRLEQAVGIGQLDTNLGGTSLRRQAGIDEDHLTLEGPIGIGADRELRLLPRPNQRQILLENLSDEPDGIEVSNSIKNIPWLKAHTFHRGLLQHHTAHRRSDRQSASGLAGTAQPLKLCFSDIPVA